jgi:hypothetical protein
LVILKGQAVSIYFNGAQVFYSSHWSSQVARGATGAMASHIIVVAHWSLARGALAIDRFPPFS